jgi:hypothetical protein
LRPVRCTGRLCLTYAVCNDTALVNAYFARSTTRVRLPIEVWHRVVHPTKAVGRTPWCDGEIAFTCAHGKMIVQQSRSDGRMAGCKKQDISKHAPYRRLMRRHMADRTGNDRWMY